MSSRPERHSGERFHRLVEVLLPGGGDVVVMFEGYFDESGSFEEEPGVFCISGYFIEAEQARLMDAAWRDVLREHHIPFFHMVDCAHGAEAFEDMEVQERIEIATKLIALIKKHTVSGFSALAYAKHFHLSPKYPDEYSACVDSCIVGLESFLDLHRLDSKNTAYFFESGHKNKGLAYQHVAKKIEQLGASITFAGKEQVPLLQAADILAWQSTKYVKDRMSGARGPRKDFLSLMEHRHSLLYQTVQNGEMTLAMEDFPYSVRSQHTVGLNLNTDGPITYFTINDEKTPIIAVKAADAWAEGPGKMAMVRFSDFKNEEFYLGFDEMRLSEAIFAALSATEVFKDSEMRPIIKAIDVSAGVIKEDVILRLTLSQEASVHFRMSPESAKKLQAALSKHLGS